MRAVRTTEAARLRRCAVTFHAGDPPRSGTVTFADPAGETRLPVEAAVPVLTAARRAPDAHPAAVFWGSVAVAALQLVARGRVLPGVSPAGFDAWRAGPLDAADRERLRTLAESVPGPRTGEAPEDAVRSFVDAVADAMPRTGAAAMAAGAPVFAAREPQPAGHLRGWAAQAAAGMDQGVRISLRVEAGADPGSAPLRMVVQVHSLTDPAQVLDAAALWQAGDGGRAQTDTMLAVRRAARVWPPLERLLQHTVPDELTLADEEVAELLGPVAHRLDVAGVEVHWPRELLAGLRASVSIGADRPGSDLPGLFAGGALLEASWQLTVDDDPLTAAEMDRLAEAHRPLVRLRDRWLLLDPETARRARQRSLKPVSALDALGAALTGTLAGDGEQLPVTPASWLADLRARIADPDGGAEPVTAPEGLHATLRDYQLRGLRWLVRMTSLGLGCCLADDMGLGKTITLIALHLHRAPAAAGPTLVVCPASLLGNWEREIRRFAPGVPVRRFHGAQRSLDDTADGVVLTTYGTMRLDAARLATCRWGLLVADEAQHVKNHLSGTAKALREIGADARVALTGTPVENNLSELWSIVDWTTPGLLGGIGTFCSRWATPIEADSDQAAAAALARLVAPFLLRRRKSDPGIAPELPPKTETTRPVELTAEQSALYTATVRELMAEVSRSSGMMRRGLVVKLLTGLKQICNHPAQYLREPQGRLAGRSGKFELLDELLDEITAGDGAVLVFTQYVAMARLIERHLRERGTAARFLHGGTPVRRREELVAEFQAGAVPVFLLSLKAAGTGLNLTRADHVVHYDRWWNPAVEDQATDRAYRIGQTRPVQVHRLVAEGTVEDRIATMLETKRALADAVLGTGEAALSELSDAELAELVELRGAR